MKLQGDPTYLVVENDRTLATYGINAVCTHLGCVVPWNTAEKKFICPCHGSQYNNQGKVVRGPAPLVSHKINGILPYPLSLSLSFTKRMATSCISSLLSCSLCANYTCYLHLVQSLALAHADIDDGKVVFVPWVETDFRTGEEPWWA
jgi:cytochrome b6-f complex iron-sulfur subunit